MKHGLLGIIGFLISGIVQANGPKLPRNALPVPLVRQSTEYSCGAASAMAILYYWGVFDGHESELFKIFKTDPQQGTHPRDLVAGLQVLGLNADLRENLSLEDLEFGLQQGQTVLLSYQAWKENLKNQIGFSWKDDWEDGHYGVLVATDRNYLYLMDPSAFPGYTFVPRAEFEDRWHDYEDTPLGPWRYQHLGIFVSGKNPIKKFPTALFRLE